MSTAATIVMPDVDTVNFDDPYEIGGFISRLLNIAGQISMFMPGFKPSAQSNALRHIANKTVRKLDQVMPRMSTAKAFMIVSAYDFAHRLAYLVPANQSTLNKYILNAFNAMLHGNKEINEYAIFREIRRRLSTHDKEYFDRPLQWLCHCEQRWHKEAANRFENTNLSDYDILSRVNILLESDLFAYEGNRQQQFKQQLFEQYRHYLDSPAPTSRQMQTALYDFLVAGSRYLTPDQFETYRTRLTPTPSECIG